MSDDENRCESIDPVGLLGKNTRCDLNKGHEGQHHSRKHTYDGWESQVFWRPDPVQDELQALRKLAEKAYMVYRAWDEGRSYVNKMLYLGCAVRDWKKLSATHPISEDK